MMELMERAKGKKIAVSKSVEVASSKASLNREHTAISSYSAEWHMINSKILKCGYTATEALLLLLKTDPQFDLQDIEEVYYPYVRFRYLITGSGKRREN